jgi:hypothetical protein
VVVLLLANTTQTSAARSEDKEKLVQRIISLNEDDLGAFGLGTKGLVLQQQKQAS